MNYAIELVSSDPVDLKRENITKTMNSHLIDHLLSSYGLINGTISEIAKELESERITKNTRFKIVKETKDFKDVIAFLSDYQENIINHVLLQHTPDWTTMLSNSKEIDNFSNYQKQISTVLNRKNIRIVDTKEEINPFTKKPQQQTHLFHMIDEDAKVIRSVSCIKNDTDWSFADAGAGFQSLVFKDQNKQPKFDSGDLTDLVKAATHYHVTLNEIVERKFVLLKEA